MSCGLTGSRYPHWQDICGKAGDRRCTLAEAGFVTARVTPRNNRGSEARISKSWQNHGLRMGMMRIGNIERGWKAS